MIVRSEQTADHVRGIMERAGQRVVRIQTPTGGVAVIRPVAEQLLAQGVISGDLDGVAHAADAATLKAALMATGVCDFCSAPGPAHVFDVPDFVMPSGAGESTGGWAACDACADLVRADKRKAADLVVKATARAKALRYSMPRDGRRGLNEFDPNMQMYDAAEYYVMTVPLDEAVRRDIARTVLDVGKPRSIIIGGPA